jgi:hypothetical protein
MSSEQTRAVVDLARALARSIERRDRHLPLIEACQRCIRASDPDDFSRAAIAVAAGHLGDEAARQYLPGKLGDLLASCSGIAEANRATLGRLHAALADRVVEGAEAPILLGDAATLLGLYGTLGAFRIALLEAAVTRQVGIELVGELGLLLRSVPGEGAIAFLPTLSTVLPKLLKTTRVDEVDWRVPTGELLAMLLAARMGDNEAAPVPLLWFHLAVQLLALRDFDPGPAVEAAEELGVGPAVRRGLALMTRVLPELTVQVPMAQLDLARWELLLSTPVVSRKVVRDSLRLIPK